MYLYKKKCLFCKNKNKGIILYIFIYIFNIEKKKIKLFEIRYGINIFIKYMYRVKKKENMNPVISFYQKGIYTTKEKIYSFGDIHGDLQAFINVLKKANLINNQYNWCGGKSHVVQVGDFLDRKIRTIDESDEDSEFEIFQLIIKLKIQSFQHGGAFHTIIGNHELMNIMGIFDYVSPMGFNKFNNNPSQRKDFFKMGGFFCKQLSLFWNPVIKINTYLFCHGGISPHIANKYSINTINVIMRNTLQGNLKNLNNSFFQELFVHPNGILWNRKYSSDEPVLLPFQNMYIEKELDIVLEKYKVSSIIVGHTPQQNGITPKFNSKIFCIDVGMSEAFGKKKNKLERIEFIVIDPIKNAVYI